MWVKRDTEGYIVERLRWPPLDGRGYELLPDDHPDLRKRSPERMKRMLADAVQSHLDARARERGYDNIFTACTYAEEPAVPAFQAEGKAYREWRSLVWAKCYELLADVESGKRAIPTVSDVIAAIPLLELPS